MTRPSLAAMLILTTLLSTEAFAVEPTPPAPSGDHAAAGDFNKLRDPFWPVGWKPPSLGRVAESEDLAAMSKWRAAERLLKVSGLSRKPDGTYLAILEKAGIVEKGDMVSVKYLGLTYKWRIKDITGEGMLPERISVDR